jgi:hypothetical protein
MAEFRVFPSLCFAGLLSSVLLGPGFGSAAVIIFIKVRRDHVVALNQISAADEYARVQKFNEIDTFSTCSAFLRSIMPTAFQFLTILPLFRTYTPANAI